MRRCSCTEITEIIILKDQREQWLSILTSLTKGEFYLRLLMSVSRIYKDLKPLDVEPAEDKYLELVHPVTHIQKIKDIIYDPKVISAKKEKTIL